MPQRYSGFKYGDPAHEDFETWYLVCADAEPGWENTPEGKASARARKEEKEERQESRAENGAAEHQRKPDVETEKRENEEAERAKQEEMRQRRINEQEQAARKVAERLAAQEKAAEEDRKKKAAAERAERQRIRKEEETRARKAAEAAVRQRLAEEEERRKKKEAEEAAAAHQREEIAERKRAQANDEQWARLQTVVQAEYDDLAREHARLQDDLDAASARRWLEKRRQARLQPNNNEPTEHEPQEYHTGHDAERTRLAKISLELADLELIVKAIINSRTNPLPSSSSSIHSQPPSLSTVRSSPITASTNTNQHNTGQLNTVVSKIRVLTARDDRSDNQSEQTMRDRYDFLIQREEQRRVADMIDVLSSQDRSSPPGWFGACTMM